MGLELTKLARLASKLWDSPVLTFPLLELPTYTSTYLEYVKYEFWMIRPCINACSVNPLSLSDHGALLLL